MWEIIRESAVGQSLQFLGVRGSLCHPEEKSGFTLPSTWDKPQQDNSAGSGAPDQAHADTSDSVSNTGGTGTPNDIEKADGSRPTPAAQVPLLVTWFNESDQANPQNWSLGKKLFISIQLCLYTFTVYLGSSLYVAAETDVERIYNVSPAASSLGLALYVLGYGVGPMIFSPLSEIPILGRNWLYIATFTVFVILAMAASLVDDFGGLLALRFFLGFFGSPCLATGGATLQDMYAPTKMPYALMFWVASATLGPALGPAVTGFAVTKMGWRWSAWELLWLSGPILLLMIACFPETSADAILLRRARRLRKLTGRTNLKSESEISIHKMTARQIAFEALIKPWEINVLDPAVLFTTVYMALIYGIYYSFFESFPLVYAEKYGFNLGETGLVFLIVLVALGLSIPAYCAYFWFYAEERMKSQPHFGSPESRLVPGLIGAIIMPIGLFIYAWTSRPSVHWIVSIIGVGLNSAGLYIVMQVLFLYIPFTYPQYTASLFAANDLARSTFAAGAVVFARPMFINLTVQGGVSLLAGLDIVCVGGIFMLYFFGASLRARSKFAAG
ncbi:Caffeine resistance protein 5 [Cyphellophora attinorum]|uniref:Caffeine resistance protein 5 n=1 Tax=Cyphellophora attinorum TaxID=1664694 RepID=A0A0N1GYT5_9EURO|nr:Caffeine resistance protein 5 [Phialophora attinorum]KPI36050.1 Caffeine resistance protein 5 [Phialophora attinorum]